MVEGLRVGKGGGREGAERRRDWGEIGSLKGPRNAKWRIDVGWGYLGNLDLYGILYAEGCVRTTMMEFM